MIRKLLNFVKERVVLSKEKVDIVGQNEREERYSIVIKIPIKRKKK